jgi:hypothetical protein
MLVRISRIGGRQYIQVVENMRIEGRVRTQYLASLGCYDDGVWERAREWLEDLVPMEQAGAVVSDLQEVSGPLQKNRYPRKDKMLGRHFRSEQSGGLGVTRGG